MHTNILYHNILYIYIIHTINYYKILLSYPILYFKVLLWKAWELSPGLLAVPLCRGPPRGPWPRHPPEAFEGFGVQDLGFGFKVWGLGLGLGVRG